jgi:hypothetical protein
VDFGELILEKTGEDLVLAINEAWVAEVVL